MIPLDPNNRFGIRMPILSLINPVAYFLDRWGVPTRGAAKTLVTFRAWAGMSVLWTGMSVACAFLLELLYCIYIIIE